MTLQSPVPVLCGRCAMETGCSYNGTPWERAAALGQPCDRCGERYGASHLAKTKAESLNHDSAQMRL